MRSPRLDRAWQLKAETEELLLGVTAGEDTRGEMEEEEEGGSLFLEDDLPLSLPLEDDLSALGWLHPGERECGEDLLLGLMRSSSSFFS